MTRAELKLDAKNKMYKNYGLLLALMLIGMLASGLAASIGKASGLIAGLVSFIITACMQLSMANVCLKISKTGKATFEDVIEPLKENIVEKVLTILLSQFYLILWSALFVIPGLVKLFSYSQLLYILVDDNENIYFNEAITKSRQMMYGHKLELLILNLSFALWLIAIPLTFGILSLYVIPYTSLTISNYYLTLTGYTGGAEKIVDEEAIKEAIKIN